MHGVNWHFLGHLQSNKIALLKKVPNLTIHSVDSLALLQKLAKQLPDSPIFIQVNVSSEDSKHGFSIEDAGGACAEAVTLNMKLVGLMCIGEPSESERDFAAMVALRDSINPDLKLSMGMSADWELAQRFGSAYVRIGSDIFGSRSYAKK